MTARSLLALTVAIAARAALAVGVSYANVRKLVDEHKLHTICESGNCPNMGECWGAGTATFIQFHLIVPSSMPVV